MQGPYIIDSIDKYDKSQLASRIADNLILVDFNHNENELKSEIIDQINAIEAIRENGLDAALDDYCDDIVKRLITFGYNFNKRIGKYPSLVSLVCSCCKQETCLFVLTHCELTKETLDFCLGTVCHFRNYTIIKYLEQRGVKPSIRAMEEANLSEFTEFIKESLDKDKTLVAAFSNACNCYSPKVIDCYMKYNPNFEERDCYGFTPLMNALVSVFEYHKDQIVDRLRHIWKTFRNNAWFDECGDMLRVLDKITDDAKKYNLIGDLLRGEEFKFDLAYKIQKCYEPTKEEDAVLTGV